MLFLRQSTAVDLALGPFLDSTDGITAETALTIAQADVRLKKNNGAWAQITDATSATHEENGWYEKEFDATDTNTVGILLVAVHEAGALPVWHEFTVLEEAVYDALYAAGAPGFATPAQVNAEVVDALNVDTYAEPGQGAPAATTTLAGKLGYLFKAWRNRHTQTATEYALYADDTTTKDQEAVVSSDGTTTVRGEVGTGA